QHRAIPSFPTRRSSDLKKKRTKRPLLLSLSRSGLTASWIPFALQPRACSSASSDSSSLSKKSIKKLLLTPRRSKPASPYPKKARSEEHTSELQSPCNLV